jgi:hypothetical protein
MTIISRSDAPLRDSDQLAEIVHDMGELFRQHVASLSGRIKALDERVHELEERCEDLEGHAEHGTDATCGICVPDVEPETVSADEYGSGVIAISDFYGPCGFEPCQKKIEYGDEVRYLEGKWVHRDCN